VLSSTETEIEFILGSYKMGKYWIFYLNYIWKLFYKIPFNVLRRYVVSECSRVDKGLCICIQRECRVSVLQLTTSTLAFKNSLSIFTTRATRTSKSHQANDDVVVYWMLSPTCSQSLLWISNLWPHRVGGPLVARTSLLQVSPYWSLVILHYVM
jgi:hypothetical protein